MKINLILSIILVANLVVSCQDKEPEPDVTLPPTGCDGNLNGTDCQQFFVPEGETLSYPANTTIKVSEGIEINGDIIIDASEDGNFTITATDGDIIIAGRILIKDTASTNPSDGRYKTENYSSRLKNGKSADGFTLTLDARGQNGNIILKKGATLFSGRGQHALDENLTSLSGYYEGTGGGNGGFIILNAPNGKVTLPNIESNTTSSQEEVFVLGNGGKGADVVLEGSLEIGDLSKVEVRGGLGGNAGQLIIDALEIDGIPTLENMETHPDFIFGGKGGDGGFVIWENAGKDKKYVLDEVILHGGEGGDGAKAGGYGGWAIFSESTTKFVEIGDKVPPVYCYGGDGGEVFGSPLPHKEVWGGYGGGFIVRGVAGWDGGENEEGTLFVDGANGGNALGQGGNGGDIQAEVRAYLATGGSGGISEEDRTYIPDHLNKAELPVTSAAFGVVGGDGGQGYSACEGCPGGKGGHAGTATAIGGNGGNVLGQANQSMGGDGGDIWALLRGIPGNGGNGNPGGSKGSQQPGIFLSENPGTGGEGSTQGAYGETLAYDLNGDLTTTFDGETCGEELECHQDTTSNFTPCTMVGATATYYYKETKPVVASQNIVTGEQEYDDEEFIYEGQATVLSRDPLSNAVTSMSYTYSTTHNFKTAGELQGDVIIAGDTSVRKEDSFVQQGPYAGLPGVGPGIASWILNPQCDMNGTLQWPGYGRYFLQWNYGGIPRDYTKEWQVSGCISFDKENSEIDRSHTQCCEYNSSIFPFQPCYKP